MAGYGHSNKSSQSLQRKGAVRRKCNTLKQRILNVHRSDDSSVSSISSVRTDCTSLSARSVDVIFTCLAKKQPQFPLREELVTLGFEALRIPQKNRQRSKRDVFKTKPVEEVDATKQDTRDQTKPYPECKDRSLSNDEEGGMKSRSQGLDKCDECSIVSTLSGRTDFTSLSARSVDIVFTCLTKKPPALPLREEVPTLGFEALRVPKKTRQTIKQDNCSSNLPGDIQDTFMDTRDQTNTVSEDKEYVEPVSEPTKHFALSYNEVNNIRNSGQRVKAFSRNERLNQLRTKRLQLRRDRENSNQRYRRNNKQFSSQAQRFQGNDTNNGSYSIYSIDERGDDDTIEYKEENSQNLDSIERERSVLSSAKSAIRKAKGLLNSEIVKAGNQKVFRANEIKDSDEIITSGTHAGSDYILRQRSFISCSTNSSLSTKSETMQQHEQVYITTRSFSNSNESTTENTPTAQNLKKQEPPHSIEIESKHTNEREVEETRDQTTLKSSSQVEMNVSRTVPEIEIGTINSQKHTNVQSTHVEEDDVLATSENGSVHTQDIVKNMLYSIVRKDDVNSLMEDELNEYVHARLSGEFDANNEISATLKFAKSEVLEVFVSVVKMIRNCSKSKKREILKILSSHFPKRTRTANSRHITATDKDTTEEKLIIPSTLSLESSERSSSSLSDVTLDHKLVIAHVMSIAESSLNEEKKTSSTNSHQYLPKQQSGHPSSSSISDVQRIWNDCDTCTSKSTNTKYLMKQMMYDAQSVNLEPSEVDACLDRISRRIEEKSSADFETPGSTSPTQHDFSNKTDGLSESMCEKKLEDLPESEDFDTRNSEPTKEVLDLNTLSSKGKSDCDRKGSETDFDDKNSCLTNQEQKSEQVDIKNDDTKEDFVLQTQDSWAQDEHRITVGSSYSGTHNSFDGLANKNSTTEDSFYTAEEQLPSEDEMYQEELSIKRALDEIGRRITALEREKYQDNFVSESSAKHDDLEPTSIFVSNKAAYEAVTKRVSELYNCDIDISYGNVPCIPTSPTLNSKEGTNTRKSDDVEKKLSDEVTDRKLSSSNIVSPTDENLDDKMISLRRNSSVASSSSFGGESLYSCVDSQNTSEKLQWETITSPKLASSTLPNSSDSSSARIGIKPKEKIKQTICDDFVISGKFSKSQENEHVPPLILNSSSLSSSSFDTKKSSKSTMYSDCIVFKSSPLSSSSCDTKNLNIPASPRSKFTWKFKNGTNVKSPCNIPFPSSDSVSTSLGIQSLKNLKHSNSKRSEVTHRKIIGGDSHDMSALIRNLCKPAVSRKVFDPSLSPGKFKIFNNIPNSFGKFSDTNTISTTPTFEEASHETEDIKLPLSVKRVN